MMGRMERRVALLYIYIYPSDISIFSLSLDLSVSVSLSYLSYFICQIGEVAVAESMRPDGNDHHIP